MYLMQWIMTTQYENMFNLKVTFFILKVRLGNKSIINIHGNPKHLFKIVIYYETVKKFNNAVNN